MSAASRRTVEEAYAEAVRTAALSSALGAVGFGVALVMAVLLVTRGAFLSLSYGLEMILLAGGVSGGVAFTVLAVRAGRMARTCQRRLERGAKRHK